MENILKKVFIALLFLTGSFTALGQEENYLDHIYNKWVFSSAESSNGIQVYRAEGFFEDTKEAKANLKRWRFAAHSDVFINAPYQENVYPWRIKRRCGNDLRHRYNVPARTKGKWELLEENGATSLLLYYYRAEKGKPFQLAKTVRYLVVHLEKDLMELTMINNRNDS